MLPGMMDRLWGLGGDSPFFRFLWRETLSPWLHVRLWGQAVSINTEPGFSGLPPLTVASRFYSMEPWRPPWLFLLASSHHVPAHSSHTGLAGHMTLVPSSLLVHFPLPGALFPSRSLHLFTSFESQLTCHLPQEPFDYSVHFQLKPTHPRSQHLHHLPALFSFWRVLLFELPCWFICLPVCCFSPPHCRERPCLSCLVLAQRPRKAPAQSLVDEMAHPLPTPGPQPLWHAPSSTMPMHLWPHSLTPSSSVQMQRNLKPWKMLPNTHFYLGNV